MEQEAIGLVVAFMAGLLSFLSPCVLPLVPSYASFITGMSLEELTDGRTEASRRGVLVHGGLFVAGFTAVFLLLGASATFLGSFLRAYSGDIARAGGVILIVFGLYLLGLLRLPGASREWRVHFANKPAGYFGSTVVGFAFGAGWTPCIGPVLGGILTLAASRASVADGMGLLAIYSAGLAVPFLASTLLLDRFLLTFARFRRWLPWVSRANGVLLIAVGILMLSGQLTYLSGLLAQWTPDFLLRHL
jgi:cytochrome c-type biogenesis protein